MDRDMRRDVVWNPLKIWAGLLVLLLLTWGYAYWPKAPGKTEVSLAIGAAKAALVAWYFMQLREAAGVVRLASMAGLLWASLLFLFAFADFLTR